MMERPETRYAKNGDVHIGYQVVGEGPIDLVFCSGIFSNIEVAWEHPVWNSFYRRLAAFSRLITYDLRGIGISDRGKEPPHVEIQMDDLRAVMDSVGSQVSNIFGVARGSVPAAMFAATYPDRVSTLALYSFPVKALASPGFPIGETPEQRVETESQIFGAFGKGTGLALQAPTASRDESIVKWWAHFERLVASPGAIRELLEVWRSIDLTSILPSIRVPTLIMHRVGDQVVSVDQARYAAKQIPHAKLRVLEGADHLPIFGDSDEIVHEVAEFVTGLRPAPDVERILTTVMFLDLVGSTDQAAAMGDRAWRERLVNFYSVVEAEIKRFGGRLVKTTGDGALACFDGPARATRCGLALSSVTLDMELRMRTGLHTGECELMGDDLGGIAVHIAARVMSLAQPGTVLASSTVRDLSMGSGIVFTEQGKHILKGVPDEWTLFEATDMNSPHGSSLQISLQRSIQAKLYDAP